MARLKKLQDGPSLLERIQNESIEFNKKNPIIGRRWLVFEFFPSHTNSEGVYRPDRWIRLTSPVPSEEEAKELATGYEPERGAQIVVKQENLRRFTEERWVFF